MAQQQDQDTPINGFRSIQLLKDQSLGIGSYGSVCKALCDDLLCAAKIIHPTLYNPNAHRQIVRQREHRLPIQRFMQECEFMSAIRHPNIVQFLGTNQDSQTGLPVLLMELMDDSLTHFLESSRDILPYHIQVKFCHDITLAISYLHSNGITHRDLSSNNVLLRGNVIAKVTDFGMAKIGDINPQATCVSFTLCPGTDAYMPPEAVKDPPIYTEKIDCFSIGTLIIQILTRCFPNPGDRHKTIHIDHPEYPSGIVDVRVPEIERRQNHISLVDSNHPLLIIALDCLKDSDIERSSAQELCHRVAVLKTKPQFTESVQTTQEPADTTEREEELRQQVQDKDDIIQQKDRQLQGLQQIIGSQNNRLQQKDDIIQEKNNVIEEKDKIIRNNERTIVASKQEFQRLRATVRDQQRQLTQITQQLESSQQVTAQFQKRNQELEEQLKSKLLTELPIKPQHSHRVNPQKKAPCEMSRGANAVDGEMVYIRSAAAVYAYNSRNKIWGQFPDCRYSLCSLVVIQNSLTAIGGCDSGGKATNQLLSLTGSVLSKRSWKEVLPPMPTKRSHTTAVHTGQAVIVAGGRQGKKTLRTVEVMDIDRKQWSSAADLPEPLSLASSTICAERLYIGGGWNDRVPIRSVYTCTMAELLPSCQSRSLGKHWTQSLSPTPPPRCWSKVSDLPVTHFTCITLHDQLLAIGGKISEDKITSDVRQYHPTSKTWEVISQMDTSRWLCFAAVLPTNELMVVGGYTNRWGNETDSVETLVI